MSVKLINTDGLAFIGPGSEWFWAAAQFVVVVITLVGIYRQLRVQGAANFVQRIETLQGDWSSPRMAYTRLVVALHLRYEQPDKSCYLKAKPILDFFANLQNLEIEGYLSVDEIGANWNRSIQEWTAFTAPLVEARRKTDDNLNLYDLDPLIMKLRKWEQKRGAMPLSYEGDAVQRLLDEAILYATAALQLEAEWRSGIIPEPPAASGAP